MPIFSNIAVYPVTGGYKYRYTVDGHEVVSTVVYPTETECFNGLWGAVEFDVITAS